MHDPLVVAFDIRRPWPTRSRSHDTKPGQPRWKIRHHHVCGDHCADRAKHEMSNPFPWWRPGSYSTFWTLAGRGWYWPTLVTIWHVEPGGRDSGEVCRHYTRVQRPDGTGTYHIHRGWRWHIHHWRIQVPSLQHLRRRLLTRCEWCAGRHCKADPINVSNSWGRDRTPWWRGETGLFHLDCSAVARARRSCLCEAPVCDRTDSTGRPHGRCARCDRPRQFGASEALLARQRLLAAIPDGQRNPAVYARVCAMADAERKNTDTRPA